MNNSEFLQTIKESFVTCLKTHPNSNEKLKVLHGAIAKDIFSKINIEHNAYSIKSLGFEAGKEHEIQGRYISNKAIDITIINNSNNEIVAGIGVKFVMSNYSQNSNNYFENMLGETSNIRSAGIPYFQIFIIPETVPHFKDGGALSGWESIVKPNKHYIDKYIKLSKDSIDNYMHAPNKTLFVMINIGKENTHETITSRKSFVEQYLNNDFSIEFSNIDIYFGESFVYNNYEEFSKEVIDSILAV